MSACHTADHTLLVCQDLCLAMPVPPLQIYSATPLPTDGSPGLFASGLLAATLFEWSLHSGTGSTGFSMQATQCIRERLDLSPNLEIMRKQNLIATHNVCAHAQSIHVAEYVIMQASL